MNRKALARTSSQPGKTQTINYYNINNELYFVDLPGYGYAKVPESEKEKWGRMVERYLSSSKQLKAIFLLIDIRHEPSGNDKLMYDYIRESGYEPLIIATKADKIKRSLLSRHISLIRNCLNISTDTVIIPFSAPSKTGRDDIYEKIDEILENIN
jgi:GTP-binding protein